MIGTTSKLFRMAIVAMALVWASQAHAVVMDVTAPGDPISIFPAASTSPGGETVDHAIDNVTQKYLNFGTNGASTPYTGNTGFVVTPSLGKTKVTGLRIFTANDAEVRDPADFTLEGSNDGVSFTLIASGPLALPAGRNGGGGTPILAFPDPAATQFHQDVFFANNSAFATYRVVFPNVKDNAAANSMQIGEIELLGEAALVPEPATAGLLGLGLLGVFGARRRRTVI